MLCIWGLGGRCGLAILSLRLIKCGRSSEYRGPSFGTELSLHSMDKDRLNTEAEGCGGAALCEDLAGTVPVDIEDCRARWALSANFKAISRAGSFGGGGGGRCRMTDIGGG